MERSSRRLYTKTPPNRGLIRPRGTVKSGKPSVHAVLRPGPERTGEQPPSLKAALDVRHRRRPNRLPSRILGYRTFPKTHFIFPKRLEVLSRQSVSRR